MIIKFQDSSKLWFITLVSSSLCSCYTTTNITSNPKVLHYIAQSRAIIVECDLLLSKTKTLIIEHNKKIYDKNFIRGQVLPTGTTTIITAIRREEIMVMVLLYILRMEKSFLLIKKT